MDFFQSRDDLQIWTMAQGGSAGAETLREVRSPDGNLHWQVLKIIRDSSRLYIQLSDCLHVPCQKRRWKQNFFSQSGLY